MRPGPSVGIARTHSNPHSCRLTSSMTCCCTSFALQWVHGPITVVLASPSLALASPALAHKNNYQTREPIVQRILQGAWLMTEDGIVQTNGDTDTAETREWLDSL